MAERHASDLIALEDVDPAAHPPEVQEVIDAVQALAQRLDQNVCDVEHLMVVGAENGIATMGRVVPSLGGFRELLLDAMYDDRDHFRHMDDKVWFSVALVDVLGRLRDGEDPEIVMLDVMLSDNERIHRAVQKSQKDEPEIVLPDTLVLDQSSGGRKTIVSEDIATAASVSPEARDGRLQQASRAGLWPTASPTEKRDPDPPLIRDLLADTADDPKLVGRKDMLDQVARILLRFRQPSVMLVGDSGSGKTAFVRGLARAAADGELPALTGFRFYQLKLLDLVAQGHQGQDIHNILDQVFGHIANDRHGVLVIDDLHMLVAKQGAPMLTDVIDTVKFHLKKNTLRAIVTVDREPYEASFRGDPFFSTEMSIKQLPVLERDDVLAVLGELRSRLEKHFDVTITDEALEAATTASLESREYVPPGASIRILDEACSLARARMVDEVTAEHVTQSLKDSESTTASDFDRRRLASLERVLSERVLGQHAAAEAMARRVRLAKLKLDRKPERPDGVFLSIGPSGVGKTEMARALATALYDDESRLIRLDMSEYMEPHSVSRIIGAPPGYVGYGEEGALTGPVSRLGHAIVLLDEIEKAHPQVLNLFLQVFDDGRLTDSRGRTVAFSDTVIIMTSNIGRELYAVGGDAGIGFTKDADAPDKPMMDMVRNHLLKVLPPEFVNRIDELIPFRVLGDDDILEIATKLLKNEADRWATWGKTLTYDDDVVKVIATAGYDPRLGARHIERNVERFVITLISDAAVHASFDNVKTLELAVVDGKVALTMDEAAPTAG